MLSLMSHVLFICVPPLMLLMHLWLTICLFYFSLMLLLLLCLFLAWLYRLVCLALSLLLLFRTTWWSLQWHNSPTVVEHACQMLQFSRMSSLLTCHLLLLFRMCHLLPMLSHPLRLILLQSILLDVVTVFVGHLTVIRLSQSLLFLSELFIMMIFFI
jgi:hypothetical protein